MADKAAPTGPAEVIARMRELTAERERLAADLAATVADGRALGMTWEHFGDGFGITRQAARQRWGRS